MTVSDAWLLECSDTISIAVGDHEMVEFVSTPIRFAVPASPQYCSSVLLWQENLVPVMDIAALLGHSSDEVQSPMCLLTYQEQPGTALQQLVVPTTWPPEKIRVDDEQACELPEVISNSVLMPVSLSCFTHADQPVIILDIARLCSAEFRDAANAA